MELEGNILKMKSSLSETVEYHLPMGEEQLSLNAFIGQDICFEFDGQINCIATGEKIKKSYNQGYSYKSFISLARCDLCIMKPETCHYDKGTCREPKWGEEHCMIPHFIYLSNTSGLKVGITRHTQIPTRWIDQGATWAIPIAKVKNRKTSGLIEVAIGSELNDKTDWRKMLKGNPQEIDLGAKRAEIHAKYAQLFKEYDAELVDDPMVHINYPVESYPSKVSSLSFDKKEVIEGKLLGIKGQYLIMDCGVLNMRKHQGYYLRFMS